MISWLHKSAFFLLTLLGVSSVHALTVTTLNIQWFGSGGDMMGSASDEYRQERIKDYIENVLPDTDIFAFQEIVNKDELYKVMIDYECISYDTTRRHQYVVLCSKKGLLQTYEVNNEVQLGRGGLRAAIIGTYKKEKESLVKVIGVHLKAGWEHTSTRINQIQALQESLKENIPTIVVGDFNTYPKERTSLELSDEVLISNIISDFSMLQNRVPTYMGFGGRNFDRAWVRGLEILNFEVYGPCKRSSVPEPYNNRNFYKRFVSDHCALNFAVSEN